MPEAKVELAPRCRDRILSPGHSSTRYFDKPVREAVERGSEREAVTTASAPGQNFKGLDGENGTPSKNFLKGLERIG